ncbi:MAG TPA: GGDEF domain-containing protein [Clostridia bacterium]|nr:GGDEF domain-containing protein [Clostridia bacterium]
MSESGVNMEEQTKHTLHVESIRQDLNRITEEWLQLHFRLAAVLVIIALAVEIAMAFFIATSDILTTTIVRYILKFILVPSGFAGFFLLAARLAIKSTRLSSRTKIYTMSLLFVLICFVYYTAHSAFVAIYALYAFAIFLTTTYADYKLTWLVSLAALLSLVISELLLCWDLDKVSVFADASRFIDFLVALSVVIGCSLVSIVTIQYEKRKNETSLRREVERELLKESILYDELTGTYNRKALHDALRALEQITPAGPLVFGIADIDYFKSVNDLYGHHVGDLCLMEFACVLCEYFGEGAVYRYSGDEFCLILHNTTLQTAEQLCERAQLRLRRVEFEGIPELKPTVCFGLSVYTKQDGASRLFNQADEALYEAKRVRNAVRVFQQGTATTGDGASIPLQEKPSR